MGRGEDCKLMGIVAQTTIPSGIVMKQDGLGEEVLRRQRR